MKKWLCVVLATMLCVSAFAKKSVETSVLQIIPLLEQTRAKHERISKPQLEVLVRSFVVGKKNSSLKCTETDDTIDCTWTDGPTYIVRYQRKSEGLVKTIEVGTLPVVIDEKTTIPGQMYQFPIFPERCVVNSLTCGMLARELNFIEKNVTVDSPGYDLAITDLFGSGLESWERVRDGGSREYHLNNGLKITHLFNWQEKKRRDVKFEMPVSHEEIVLDPSGTREVFP